VNLWLIPPLAVVAALCIFTWWYLHREDKRRGNCTRRNCQVCRYGQPVDGEPLEAGETRRWAGIWQALESGVAAPEHEYRRQP
jgi:hypothetical protein